MQPPAMNTTISKSQGSWKKVDFASQTQSSVLGSPKNTPGNFAPWSLLRTHLSSTCVLPIAAATVTHFMSGRHLILILPKELVQRHNSRLISHWSEVESSFKDTMKKHGQRLMEVLFYPDIGLTTENSVVFIKRSCEQVNSFFCHNIFCHNVSLNSSREFLSTWRFGLKYLSFLLSPSYIW